MNESRKLYLSTYGTIDRMDHLIQNCDMNYRSWKYWHSAMLHAKSMAVVVAYDIYKEICEGTLDPDLRINKPVDFHRFREKLALQMLQYDPKRLKYPGDEKFRTYTQQPKAKRRRHGRTDATVDSTSVNSDFTTRSGIGKADLIENSTRLCGFLDELIQHEKSVKPLEAHRSLVCISCGKACYHRCTLCPGEPALHFHKPTGRSSSCFVLHYAKSRLLIM